MDHFFYPAVFHSADKGGFWISFPDFPECLTQGKNMEDAYEMATEALGLCIDEKLKNNVEMPQASVPTDLVLEKGDFTCVIEFDMLRYRKTHNSKAVKKTLSIPEWLNEAAVMQNINFSQVLQEALIDILNKSNTGADNNTVSAGIKSK